MMDLRAPSLRGCFCCDHSSSNDRGGGSNPAERAMGQKRKGEPVVRHALDLVFDADGADDDRTYITTCRCVGRRRSTSSEDPGERRAVRHRSHNPGHSRGLCHTRGHNRAHNLAASATAGLRGRGRPAYQNRRRASDVDEQQSQRCEAARQDIVAFSHSKNLRVTSMHLDFGTTSLIRARKLSVQMRQTIFLQGSFELSRLY